MKASIIICFLAASLLHGQSDSDLVKIILKDGSELTGYMLSENTDTLVIKTLSEVTINLPLSSVESVKKGFYRIENGSLRKNDPDASHFFLAPSGRVMQGTQIRLGVYELFFPFLAVSYESRVMISGGISLLPGAKQQLYYFAPKVQFLSSNSFNLSGGFLLFGADDDNYSFVYGSGTLGSIGYAFTVTLGYGYHRGDFSKEGLVILGGETQISENSKIIAEAWLLTSEATMISFGMRNFGFGGAFEFGFYTVLNTKTSGFPFIPWLRVNFNL